MFNVGTQNKLKKQKNLFKSFFLPFLSYLLELRPNKLFEFFSILAVYSECFHSE